MSPFREPVTLLPRHSVDYNSHKCLWSELTSCGSIGLYTDTYRLVSFGGLETLLGLGILVQI